MKESTITTLLALNRTLYADHAEHFSKTRQKPWVGWDRLATRLQKPTVLDAGCGNGRFGLFLEERGKLGSYTGVDESRELLALARTKLPAAELIEADLISWTPSTTYDLVVAMGVLHHLPTLALREQLVSKLAAATKSFLALTFWSFDPKKAIDPTTIGVDPRELEEGDHILRFGEHAIRYCHLASEAEIIHLIESTGLRLEDRWDADDFNRYALLIR